MMLATWDSLIWYFLPYDMDTLFGVRNDSVLKYEYTITHESFDDSIGSYALPVMIPFYGNWYGLVRTNCGKWRKPCVVI